MDTLPRHLTVTGPQPPAPHPAEPPRSKPSLVAGVDGLYFLAAEVMFQHGRGYRTGAHWLASDMDVAESMGCSVVPVHAILFQKRIEAAAVLAAALGQ